MDFADHAHTAYPRRATGRWPAAQPDPAPPCACCTPDGGWRLTGWLDGPAATRPAGQLSPRERQIAHLVGLGHTNKTIAGLLGISLWTVSTHLRRTFAKLGVSTRAAMVGALAAAERAHPAGGPSSVAG
jgi:DNA-binding CsgD family transcriptional regulator